jgi:PTS system nitrogen regulatory IIA component
VYISDDERLRINLILPDLKAASTVQVYEMLAQKAGAATGFPVKTLFTQLSTREQQASSGIGEGVAIPHLRLPKLSQPHITFARLNRGVDFKSVDDYPVDIIMMLLSPGGDGPHHLRRLSRISRLMRDQDLLEDLRSAGDAESIEALFTHSSQRLIAAA